MTKKLLLLGLVALLLAGAIAPAAFAATTDEQQQAINEIYQKMAEYRKQLVQKYLDAGIITQEQADLMIQRIDLMTQYRLQLNAAGAYGPGFGCFGGSPGFCGGFGGFRGGFRGAAFTPSAF